MQVGIEQSCPDDVVKMALEKCQSRSAIAIDSYENYVLRVSGRDEYFLGTYPLSQFRVCIQPSLFAIWLFLVIVYLIINCLCGYLLFTLCCTTA